MRIMFINLWKSLHTHTHMNTHTSREIECGGQMVNIWMMLVEESIAEIFETEEVRLPDGEN